MATNYFLTSVADAYMYDSSDNLVAYSKVLMDSGLELTTSNTDVTGGKGNPLQYIYFHTPDLSVTLTDVQFNLDFLAQTVGDAVGTGANVYTEETVTLGVAGAGTVAGTPLGVESATLYGWVTHADVDAVERVVFTGSAFTSAVGAENDIVCVRYYHLDSAARELTVYSNIIPNKVRLVLDAQLGRKQGATSSVIGKVEVVIPNFQLSGGFSLAMAADQVAQTPLTGRALASNVSEGGCTARDVYAYIKRVITGANWYDTTEALAIVGGDITLATTLGTNTPVIKALHTDGTISTAPIADLTYATLAAGTATYVANLITGVAAGSTFVSATITAKPSIDVSVKVTVPA